MISKPPPRAPHQSTPNFQQHHHSPNAALLIDFDNVTMGIRSDLGKELKSLLNSEVIRGKVAVQRAYADWRRYPQYIVPLAESSIDLIFAPAYGSAKKNATDLRMAIDAIELVFTRPEIGTFILMTGDSDFSSCVLKLKEYGKYVIGVGMRESSSDLLIQNCDEYYSYHSLSGLTRAGEVEESSEDPWVLVKRAATQMIANRDVMRTDRLKQVMLELDPGFDEKKIGYSKFSRFVQEAATKGLIRLRKGENGQSEIVAGDDDGSAPYEPAPPREERERSRGRGRGGDRGRGRDREPRAEAPRELAPQAAREETLDAPAPEAVAAPAAAPAGASGPAEEARPAAAAAARETLSDDEAPILMPGLPDAYGLLQEAVRSLTSGSTKSVRDGDVKRKMLGLSPGFDEAALGFSKFTRFLRQAHDAEAIDLKRVNGGNYEVSLPASGKRLPSPATQGGARSAPASAPEQSAAEPRRERAPRQEREAAEAPAPRERAEPRGAAPAAPIASAAPAAAPSPAASSQPSRPAAASPAAPVGALRGGRRGGRPLEGPPPILPGQGIPVARAAAAPASGTQAPAATASEEPRTEGSAEQPRRGRGGRGRGGKSGGREASAASEPQASAAPPEAQTDESAAPSERSGGRGRRGRGRGRRGGAAEAPSRETGVEPSAKSVVTPPAAPSGSAGTAAKSGRGRGRGVTPAAPAATQKAAAAPARGAAKQEKTAGRRGGASAKETAPAKSAAKSAPKAAAKGATKAASKAGTKSAAKSASKTATKSGAKTAGGRGAAKKGSKSSPS